LAEYDATPEADHARAAEQWRYGAAGVVAFVEGRFEDAIGELWSWDEGNSCRTCALPWLARAYDRAGVADSAVALFERFVETPSASTYFDAGHLAHAYARLGELHEERGDREKAIDYYGRFVALWENADQEMQPWVDQARQSITRLMAEPQQ